MIKSIEIKGIELSQNEVEHVVYEWYTNGMFPNILQDDEGNDLDEVLSVQHNVKIQTNNLKTH